MSTVDYTEETCSGKVDCDKQDSEVLLTEDFMLGHGFPSSVSACDTCGRLHFSNTQKPIFTPKDKLPGFLKDGKIMNKLADGSFKECDPDKVN